VKFLVDQNLSPRLATALAEHGHDAVHTFDLGLGDAPDEVVLDRARIEDRTLISADSDFGTILASTRATRPSVIFIRRIQGRRVEQLSDLVVDNLDLVGGALAEGSLVVLGEGSARIRRLPIL
jgi:predicted nuclease of predicted toxin-antitoxin system